MKKFHNLPVFYQNLKVVQKDDVKKISTSQITLVNKIYQSNKIYRSILYKPVSTLVKRENE